MNSKQGQRYVAIYAFIRSHSMRYSAFYGLGSGYMAGGMNVPVSREMLVELVYNELQSRTSSKEFVEGYRRDGPEAQKPKKPGIER